MNAEENGRGERGVSWKDKSWEKQPFISIFPYPDTVPNNEYAE